MRSSDLKQGDDILLDGQYPPCPSCKGSMNTRVREQGGSVTYKLARWYLGERLMVKAGHVLDESANFEAVVLVDEASGDTFELQRAIAFDDQDRALGQDTYCLARSGAAHYGGLVDWRVAEGVLAMRFADAAASALDLPRETEIAVSAEAQAIIGTHFPRLLG